MQDQLHHNRCHWHVGNTQISSSPTLQGCVLKKTRIDQVSCLQSLMLRSETRCLINKYEWCWVCTCMCKQYKRDLHCHRMIKELHGLVVQPHQRLPDLHSNTNKLNCARCVTNAHHTGREQWWQAAWRNSNVTNDILIRTAKTCRSIEHTACRFRSWLIFTMARNLRDASEAMFSAYSLLSHAVSRPIDAPSSINF